jgi:predicted nuclease of restriction endonuclease-like (RecB) superfamily
VNRRTNHLLKPKPEVWETLRRFTNKCARFWMRRGSELPAPSTRKWFALTGSVGQAIVEDEQQGEERAGYGEQIIQLLSARLEAEGLKGFGRRNLAWMREFYLKFQNLHALRAELSWTHYRLLLKVESDAAREFYETETVAGNWSTRELERQINSHFFERIGASIEKRKMLEAGRASKDKYHPQDFVKDPFVLEFLNLKDAPELSESDIEQALLDHLQEFLLEFGKGFSFITRQKRITTGGDHFYIDLVKMTKGEAKKHSKPKP